MMSWLSRLSGSDAKKRNLRKLGASGQQFAEMAAAGDPRAGANAFGSGVEDWARTNNRINMQTGLKGAALVAGGSYLANAGGAGGASNGVRPLGSSAAPSSGGGGIGGGLRSLGSWASKNPELILGAGSLLSGLDASRKSARNERKELELVEQLWNERAPLRALGLRNMSREMEPLDLSVYRNAANPFTSR